MHTWSSIDVSLVNGHREFSFRSNDAAYPLPRSTSHFLYIKEILRNCGRIRTTAGPGSHQSSCSALHIMLLALVLNTCLLAHIAAASPNINSQPPPQLIQYETANMPNSYNFHYQASDGSSRTEKGAILNPGTPEAALDVLGTVRWYDNKGQLYEMSYKAGKRGYRTIIKKIS
ncbi:uncharacterized protein LOC113236897 [Hyposmocoma kahamanoa]|uniref:uncharacterized protein LOC113236897 n=1 Tax=Hyposmocoma kahamanoa TaxID=1477025 RepID=UPI000E6D7625|nr:uncharacterized protein LOC113236897 [Hyposmocoma kahamanoa]